MTKATILQPTKEGGGYVWGALEIKTSKEKGAGDGVFAKVPLRVGTMIPILGKRVSLDHDTTHGWKYYSKEAVDGHPSIDPYKGVGNFGLSIAMMINESAKRKFNCKFKKDHIVVASHIKAGGELLVYYGKAYEATRKIQGYSVASNKYKDASYPVYEELKYPSATERNGNIKHWNDIIAKGSRPVFSDSKPLLISIKSTPKFKNSKPTVISIKSDPHWDRR